MPKGSQALTAARREEIVSACAHLYETMTFKDITIKEIGAATTFTRTSIYNYFQTKEEIFLALLQREYQQWADDLDGLREGGKRLSADELAQALARSLERRGTMLKLLSMNLYDMEQGSRLERLVAFKRVYGDSTRAMDRLLEKFVPHLGAEGRQAFFCGFFPFLFGVYPYTSATEKQLQAMERAGVAFPQMSVYGLIYACVKRLLPESNEQEESNMSKKLVAYFSASGVTAKAAKALAEAAGAALYEIRPQVPYTAADLDWTDKKSRSSVEMNDKSFRPALADAGAPVAEADVIFLGFPIWWYVAPTIINTFLERYDFSGKTIVLFATSGGSGFGKAAAELNASAPGAVIREGKLLNGRLSAEELSAWVESLTL